MVVRMRARGLEPPRGLPHRDLNPARLPISPRPLGCECNAAGYSATKRSPSVHPDADRGLRGSRCESVATELAPLHPAGARVTPRAPVSFPGWQGVGEGHRRSSRTGGAGRPAWVAATMRLKWCMSAHCLALAGRTRPRPRPSGSGSFSHTTASTCRSDRSSPRACADEVVNRRADEALPIGRAGARRCADGIPAGVADRRGDRGQAYIDARAAAVLWLSETLAATSQQVAAQTQTANATIRECVAVARNDRSRSTPPATLPE
jgi:hypothetical protein